MMPKVTLKAPPGVGGEIHASGSQKNYTVGGDGLVTVDSVDVHGLISAGFAAVHHSGSPATDMGPITSDSLSSDTQGAQALTQEARDASKPSPRETGPAGSHDFGSAIPPHGVPATGAGDASVGAHKQRDAELEQKTAALSGAQTSTPSAVPNTGSLPNPAASKQDQQRAADQANKKS